MPLALLIVDGWMHGCMHLHRDIWEINVGWTPAGRPGFCLLLRAVVVYSDSVYVQPTTAFIISSDMVTLQPSVLTLDRSQVPKLGGAVVNNGITFGD